MIDSQDYLYAKAELKKSLLNSGTQLILEFFLTYLLLVSIIFFLQHMSGTNFRMSLVCVIVFFSLAFKFNHHPVCRKVKIQFLKFRNAQKNFEFVSNLVTQNKEYGLYIREYRYGRNVEKYYFVDEAFFDFGNISALKVINQISRYTEIIHFSDVDDMSALGGRFLLATNLNWFENFSILTDHAKYIIIDLGEYFDTASSLKRELDYINELNKRNILLFCTKKSLTIIKNKYHYIYNNVIHCTEKAFLPWGKRILDSEVPNNLSGDKYVMMNLEEIDTFFNKK